MRYLNSCKFLLLILFQLAIPLLYGQQLPLQTFSLAADHYVTTLADGLQVDWRLDLGLTTMALDQSNRYHFSAGFLQPSINRFTKDGLEEKYNPSIELRTSVRGDAMMLFSKEPDLILFGYTIYNLHGQVILSDPTKYRSGYAGRYIDMNRLSSGVYIMQVFYLPESISFDNKNNYWVKYIKFIKP
jgi:hypothetical protein